MTDNSPGPTSEADFFKLKDSLVEFLKSKPEFTDYNFDGSALNILIDSLAYGAHIQAAHANLVFSESFLDSAQQRSSIVSHAKQIGYTPRSATGARATLRVAFSVADDRTEYVIPKNTRFTSTVDGEAYSFIVTTDTVIERTNSGQFIGDVTVYQGKFTEYNYIVSNSQTQRFVIPSIKADTRFLSVSVAATASAPYIEYGIFDSLDIDELTSTSNIFFLQESYDGFFQVYFGDNTLGKAVIPNNIVKLRYLLTDGPDANFARTFTLVGSLPSVTGFSVQTVEHAQNGAVKESNDSVKFVAPLVYGAQNRAVVEQDYIAILKANYADIDDVTVWGGEKNEPPFYGKVFLAVKPKNSTYFSNFIKQSIQNDIISKYNVLSIRPEIVDPDYTDVAVSTVLTYNAKLYKPTSSFNLIDSTKAAIETFFSSETNKFGKPLYFSKLVGAIDSSSKLILNSVTNIVLEKSANLYLGSSATYTFEYNNFIKKNSLTSTEFRIGQNNWKLKDIPDTSGITGTIRVYRKSGSIETVLYENIGTIDYNTGKIVLSNFKIDSIDNADVIGNRLFLSVSPGSFVNIENPNQSFTDFNVYTNKRNQIIRLKPTSGVTVTLLPDNT